MIYWGRNAALKTEGTLPVLPTLDLNIYSDLRQASEAVVRVGKWLEQEHVPSDCIGDITLVLAEALNNVIEHAYGDDRKGDIAVKATLRARTLSMQIVDGGRPFHGPPEEVTLQTETYDVADMPDGGYGWFLIKSLTEDIHFSHSGGKNRLTLVVALPGAPG